MRRLTSLRGLRTFCEAARSGSFREAGERLFVTASAVSHQIKNLESELGQELFERNARAIKLTAPGAALFGDVEPLLDQLDFAVSNHRRAQHRDQLSISVQPFFASELFVPKLPEFTSANPDVDIRIDTSDESNEKVASASDVSIRIFKTPPRDLVADRLFPLSLVPVSSAAFSRTLKVKGNRIESAFPLIVHDGRPGAWTQWSRHSKVSLPEKATSIRLASMIAVARAAEQGLGAALVPEELSDGWFSKRALVRLFDSRLVTDDAYYFVCKEEAMRHTPVRRLRDWVRSEFAADR